MDTIELLVHFNPFFALDSISKFFKNAVKDLKSQTANLSIFCGNLRIPVIF